MLNIPLSLEVILKLTKLCSAKIAENLPSVSSPFCFIISEQEKRKSCEESMVWYLCRSMENQICQSLSVRYRIKPVVVLQSLYKMDLDKTIKEHVEKYPDFFKKNDLERGLICDELTQSLSADLTDFEEKAKEKFLIIPKVLTKIGFEIYGVFRQAKLPISNNLQTRMVVPSIPRNLQNKILRYSFSTVAAL